MRFTAYRAYFSDYMRLNNAILQSAVFQYALIIAWEEKYRVALQINRNVAI